MEALRHARTALHKEIRPFDQEYKARDQKQKYDCNRCLIDEIFHSSLSFFTKKDPSMPVKAYLSLIL
jgi:hypothetical protein